MASKKRFFSRHAYTAIFTFALVLLTGFVLLDTFVLPHAVQPVTVVSAASSTETAADAQTESDVQIESDAAASSDGTAKTASETANATTLAAKTAEATSGEPVVTSSTYLGNGESIVISSIRVSGSTVYVADVQLSSAESLKTALAQNTFGSNITETTSAIAAANDAILAINGDYYGANKYGYVIKNGVLYRDTIRKGDDTKDLVIYTDGSFAIIDETEVSAQELVESGVVQLFAFGPALIENGEIQVSASDEVSRAKSSNPRTAIGIVDNLHYIIVVADGRTSESAGLSLLELAQLMESYGCEIAYNLDGGGSSTMVFNGTVVNNPTTNGNKISERAVSDIVYISA